jgi:ribosomal protein S25
VVARAAGPSQSGLGTGGMTSKLAAAQKAAAAGIPTVIADGTREGVLAAVFEPTTEIGTLILSDGDPLGHRKHWIAYALKPVGTIVIDDGAARALRQQGKSLLPSGVVRVDGDFTLGDPVAVLERLEAYRRVTRADLERVGRRYLDRRARTLVLVEPEDGAEADEAPDEDELDAESFEGDEDMSDEMYARAVALVKETRQASISMIQRRLRVGYNRAARMVERMEKEGIVGPADGPNRREVLASAV